MAMQTSSVSAPARQWELECTGELRELADWWLEHAPDRNRGGFYGEVGPDDRPVPDAAKSVVLNTRILWFFSELACELDEPAYRRAAERAYAYVVEHFIDTEHGGVFWMLDAEGRPTDTRKQVYAQAFAIYALVAYYQLTGEPEALALAGNIFTRLEQHTVDGERGGYREAFTRQWGGLEDLRLSDKDLNLPKTMNTHLHVLEAYTTLYRVDRSEAVARALRSTIEWFEQRIVDGRAGHLRMFMDNDWIDHSPGYTYGHDIECSWLLIKAGESLGDGAVLKRLHALALTLADTCLREAVGERGEVCDGFDFAGGRVLRERVWWVQAEALVGFYRAHTLSGEARYADAAAGVWDFIRRHQKAPGGEWLWLSDLDPQKAAPRYKLGPWKGPYHNGRAMLEMRRLLKAN